MLGNGVIGILFETCNKWEKRTPLTPSHYARLLHSGGEDTTTGVARIIVQPSTKHIYHKNWREKKKGRQKYLIRREITRMLLIK